MSALVTSSASSSFSALIAKLKEQGQDYEFYPTHARHIELMLNDYLDNASRGRKPLKMLELGAGDCRVSLAFKERITDLQACQFVEKSFVHIDNMSLSDELTLVGTDFWQTDLNSLPSDIIFCNPPYSEFEAWTTTILQSAIFNTLYLIIPKRWENSQTIADTIKQRALSVHLVAEEDFLDADRKARANVHILRIVAQGDLIDKSSPHASYHSTQSGKSATYCTGLSHRCDPLISVFANLQDEKPQSARDKEQGYRRQAQESFDNRDLAKLIESYNAELAEIRQDIDLLASASPRLIHFLNADVSTIVGLLRDNLRGLKNSYWHTFFNSYEPITSRLTQKQRERFNQNFLKSQSHLDFTFANCYAVTLLAIKYAGERTDDQIKDLYYTLLSPENIQNYKSNQKVYDGEAFRYRHSDTISHVRLEYRVISPCRVTSGYSFDDPKRFFDEKPYLSNPHYLDFIADYVAIARTVGACGTKYDIKTKDDKVPAFGTVFYIMANEAVLFEVRFYQKGTAHIRFSQDFALRLNVALGRVMGWVRSAQDVQDEFGAEACDYFTCGAFCEQIALEWQNPQNLLDTAPVQACEVLSDDVLCADTVAGLSYDETCEVVISAPAVIDVEAVAPEVVETAPTPAPSAKPSKPKAITLDLFDFL